MSIQNNKQLMQTPSIRLLCLREQFAKTKGYLIADSDKTIGNEKSYEVVTGITGYIIPRSDAHLGENVSIADERLASVSGFDGSAGIAIVTNNKAAIFVDGRYTIQAGAQVSDAWQVHSHLSKDKKCWINNNISKGDRVGYDPVLLSEADKQKWQKLLQQAGAQLIAVTHNPIDDIWTNRPNNFANPVRMHDISYAGVTAVNKLKQVKSEIASQGAECLILVAPDDIAWLFNIRGSDIPFSPVPNSFALIFKDANPVLWLDIEQVDEKVLAHLSEGQVTLRDIQGFSADFATYVKNKKLMADPEFTPAFYFMNLENNYEIIDAPNPLIKLKAVKNQTEIDAMHHAHYLDGIALVKWLVWFDDWKLNRADIRFNEHQLAQELLNFRAQSDQFIMPSFPTICGFAENGAIVHYRADESASAAVEGDSLLLVDSGGQYFGGTTDITRTLAVGDVAQNMREDCTLVMKGFIALMSAIFPADNTGGQLDAIARYPLWLAGKNYSHGTGHGVGAALCVHEAGVRVSANSNLPLVVGNILSVEPGNYCTGSHGVRMENLVVVKQSEFDGFLKFENLTLCPFDLAVLQTDMLNTNEINWINNYHKLVYDKLASALDEKERAWLVMATKAI